VTAFRLGVCGSQAFSGPGGVDHLRRGRTLPCYRKSCTGFTLTLNPVTRDAKVSEFLAILQLHGAGNPVTNPKDISKKPDSERSSLRLL
jgi:hypothetical protein